MPRKTAYARKGEITRDQREQRRLEFIRLTEKKNIGRDLDNGIKAFNAKRGIPDREFDWQNKEQPKRTKPTNVATEPKEPIVNQWVSRGVQPPIPKRYHANRDEMVRLSILTNAREIVALARARGLVAGGVMAIKPAEDGR